MGRGKSYRGNNGAKNSGRGLKSYYVCKLAAAKIGESKRLRKALRIRAGYKEVLQGAGGAAK